MGGNQKTKEKIYVSAKWISCVAMLTALVVVLGYIPGIPILTGKIYWCDFAIFTAAYLLDPLGATIVGGIGSSFFDLFGINGTAYNAIPSLIIHGLQGLSASLIFMLLKKAFGKGAGNLREGIIAAISSVLPALIVIFGYFVKRITWEAKPAAVALLKMPANVLQEVIGIAVAIIICYACRLKEQLLRARLLPSLKRKIDVSKAEDETQSEAENAEQNPNESAEENPTESTGQNPNKDAEENPIEK